MSFKLCIVKTKQWIMGSRIYGEGRTQIPLSSLTVIDSLVQDPE